MQKFRDCCEYFPDILQKEPPHSFQEMSLGSEGSKPFTLIEKYFDFSVKEPNETSNHA